MQVRLKGSRSVRELLEQVSIPELLQASRLEPEMARLWPPTSIYGESDDAQACGKSIYRHSLVTRQYS